MLSIVLEMLHRSMNVLYFSTERVYMQIWIFVSVHLFQCFYLCFAGYSTVLLREPLS